MIVNITEAVRVLPGALVEFIGQDLQDRTIHCTLDPEPAQAVLADLTEGRPHVRAVPILHITHIEGVTTR